MESVSVFDRLFSPLSCDEFRCKYFSKLPLFLEGDSTRTNGLFSVDQFFDCLADCESVRAVFPGLLQARIAPNDAQQMFDAGATICATGVELGLQSLREMLATLKTEMRFTGSLSFRAYYSPAGAGFAPHYDPRVVTTIQIEGSKNWTFGRCPVNLLPLTNSPIPLPTEFETHLEDVGICKRTLNPGNILCLPAGTLHWAEAEGGASLALNLAFDYIGDSIADKILLQVRHALLADEKLRGAAFLPIDDDTKRLIGAGLERALIILREYRQCPGSVYD